MHSLIIYGSTVRRRQSQRLITHPDFKPAYYVRAVAVPWDEKGALERANPDPHETVLNTIAIDASRNGQSHIPAAEERTPTVLLSRRQLAERWSCCIHTIARNKDLKPFRFNNRFLRYRLSDIEAFEAKVMPPDSDTQ